MTSALPRVGTSNLYANAVSQLETRQSNLSNLQSQLSSGLRVVQPSDDPAAAAQAERDMTRINRVAADQKALGLQKDAITQAESTLGSAVTAVQQFRTLVVSAGNATYNAQDIQSIVQQLTSLRDQVFSLANTQNANGQPLFAALGSALTPFVQQTGASPGYTFNGVPGQTQGSGVSIPYSLDGQQAFMMTPALDGSYNVTYGTNAGQTTTSAVTVQNPSLVTGNNYQIVFSSNAGVTQYTVNQVAPPAMVVAATNYTANTPITFDGLSLSVNGTPQPGDSINVHPNDSIFSIMDQAISAIGAAGNSTARTQAVSQALGNIDIGMNNLQTARSQAGNLLNQASAITDAQTALNTQLQANQSSAQDLDMVKGISDFQNEQTAYTAALKSYAQIQQLSMFNYVN